MSILSDLAAKISGSSLNIKNFAVESAKETDDLRARVAKLETPVPAPAPAPVPSGSRIGIATGAGPDTVTAMNDADLARYLDLVKTNGLRGIRLDAASASDSNLDRIVTATLSRGLKFLAVIKPVGMGAMTPDAYASLADQLVRKYAPKGVDEYELGNEPNLQSFYGAPLDPNGWRLRHNAAFAAIRTLGAYAIISAGLAPMGKYGDVAADRMNQITFLERALAGGTLLMDVFGYHGYDYWDGKSGQWIFDRGETDPYSSRYQLFKAPVNALGLLEKNGPRPLVEMTEFGVPTTTIPHGTTEQAQADYIPLVMAWWKAQPWARNVWWYSLKDRPSQAASTEGHYGVLRGDWTAKPGLAALKSATA